LGGGEPLLSLLTRCVPFLILQMFEEGNGCGDRTIGLKWTGWLFQSALCVLCGWRGLFSKIYSKRSLTPSFQTELARESGERSHKMVPFYSQQGEIRRGGQIDDIENCWRRPKPQGKQATSKKRNMNNMNAAGQTGCSDFGTGRGVYITGA